MKEVTEPNKYHYRLREGLFILSAAFAAFLLIALFTYHTTDPHSIFAKHVEGVSNAGGRVGAFFSDLFFFGFGYLAFLFPLIIAYCGWMGLYDLRHKEEHDISLILFRVIGFSLLLMGSTSLASICFPHSSLAFSAGGMLGKSLGIALVSVFNFTGAILFLFSLFLVGITLGTGISWLTVIERTGKGLITLSNYVWHMWEFAHIYVEEQKAVKMEATFSLPDLPKMEPKKPAKRVVKRIEKVTLPMESAVRIEEENEVTSALPPLSLLDPPEPSQQNSFSNEVLEAKAREVEARILEFGIDVQVVAVHPGPVITRFELQLAPGLKVSKISTLAKDLARALSVVSVRVVEVIPGKSVIGLEIPNEHRETVRLSEILSSQQYEQARSPLSLALGKDIAGHPVIVDLGKMPHMLVAGTTGAGKSVGLNAMLLSILYKATPDEVRFILIDPKMLELSIYEGIPHLLTPVVTDMKEASNALRWSVVEMDRRYRLMASLGVRNLLGYNTKILEARKKGTPLLDPFWNPEQSEQPTELTTLPYILVLVDEFADMMMVVGKKVEELIARIAQKARAAGIHMILATQRPSVDVITGLIKANISTRVSFQVSSKIDSRTILDQSGAEQLLGHGDMLYLAPGTGIPVRVHGAFVADQEVHNVVSAWKKRGTPQYLDDVLKGQEDDEGQGAGDDSDAGEKDPLYDEAVKIVVTSRRASISHIQRRLKIGYNRAARMIEEMESAGLVSGMESNGSREVLVPERME